MDSIGSFALLSGAVFLGAFVLGLSGFAFFGGRGRHSPAYATTDGGGSADVMACSVGVQATNLWALSAACRAGGAFLDPSLRQEVANICKWDGPAASREGLVAA
jgi:uncharacterized protein